MSRSGIAWFVPESGTEKQLEESRPLGAFASACAMGAGYGYTTLWAFSICFIHIGIGGAFFGKSMTLVHSASPHF